MRRPVGGAAPGYGGNEAGSGRTQGPLRGGSGYQLPGRNQTFASFSETPPRFGWLANGGRHAADLVTNNKPGSTSA